MKKMIVSTKRMIFALVAMLMLSAPALAMSYEQARNEALFLTDKMAYELNLTDAQYEAAYEINLDYLMGVATVDDLYGPYWERRNMDLSYILYNWQWDAFRAATYFYRPLYWNAGYWHFGIYARYPHRDYFYFGRPHFYATYRGAHSWHMNGGRSFYHSRADHFRPALPQNHQHFGMRDGFNRGDFRGVRPGSSTRITSGHSPMNNNRGSYDRSGNNSHSGSGRFSGSRSLSNGSNASPSRSFSGGNNAAPNRSFSGRNGSTQSRSSSGSFSGNRTSSSTPSRSFGGSSPTRSTSSSSATRSTSSHSSGSHSSSSSNHGGHFSSGGRR